MGEVESRPEERTLDRIRWRARRGMLENDILLTRFLEAELTKLSQDDLQLLDEFLRLNDNDLLDRLMGRTQCLEARHQLLLERIRSA